MFARKAGRNSRLACVTQSDSTKMVRVKGWGCPSRQARIGRFLSVATVSFGSILLKKSVRPNSLVIDWLKRLFCTLLREI